MAPFKEEILLEAIKQAEDKKEQKKLKKTTGGLVVTKPKACPVAPISATKSVSRHLVISNADILLWVLDARNVAECLDEGVMGEIREAGKRIIFVLNKVDLVPANVVAAWYNKLSKVADVFPIKSTEIMLTDCEQIIPAFKLKFARFGGVKELLEHLKKESEEVKVGVIGKQKVGKSCVVSSVLRACGRTKKKRSNDAKISDKVRIITTPGLIDGAKEGEPIGLLHILSNMSNYMNYPVEVIEALARVITKEQAMVHFTLPEFEHPAGFLDALAVSKSGAPCFLTKLGICFWCFMSEHWPDPILISLKYARGAHTNCVRVARRVFSQNLVDERGVPPGPLVRYRKFPILSRSLFMT
eukprot:sb/3466097/